MKKIKTKWHLFWCVFHMENSAYNYFSGNFDGAVVHQLKFIEHSQKYVDLGGDPKKIESKVTNIKNY